MDYQVKIFKNKLTNQLSIVLSKKKLKILQELKNPRIIKFKDIEVFE